MLRAATARAALLAVLLLGPPLLGAWLAGRPLAAYLEFPPTTRPTPAAPFAWPVFIALAALLAALLAPPLLRVLRAARARRGTRPRRGRGRFPGWGWAGLALLGLAWLLAWSRFPWFEPLQRHTYTPLWLGYIITVNALTRWRTGRCMLSARPRTWLALFPLSAAFWWCFELLNRFVHNWHYVGVEDFGPWQYTLFASLSFSTVLPAVLGTRELLQSLPGLSAGLGQWLRVPVRRPRALAAATLVAACAGLAGLALWPRWLFPLMWVAPLLLICALETLGGRRNVLSPLRHGDWTSLWVAALAALACGFLWELWNWGSLAHWEYTVPWVQRFGIFEMPLLGYAGYLPFGPTCVAAARFLLDEEPSGGQGGG